MQLIDRSKSFVAGEGVPVLLGLAVLAAAAWYFGAHGYALLAAALLAFGFLAFRDPRREISTAPLGIVSPVDGRVVEAGDTGEGVLGGKVHRIVIRVNPFGTYTARCPVEGKVMDLHCERAGDAAASGAGGLWLHTDEGNDVLLRFRGHRFGLVPDAIVGYGARVGQGQRCAYLRWTRFADVELPAAGRVAVSEGQEVEAGSDVLAHLPG
jgi:phosphatidylserine decarboxylase